MGRILFVHPDLGIGGAERLVIDASLALKKKGHDVSFITAHHDPRHCFPETIDGRLDVLCVGDWIPRSTFGYMYALWAYLRMVYIALYLIFNWLHYDVMFVDQVSACIPILRLKRDMKVIFYCHYPDQLLTDRKSFLKKIYRYFIDQIEELTTNMADVVLVNSYFTAGVFQDTFKSINIKPAVLYPSLDVSKYEDFISDPSLESKLCDKMVFLSLNRYERKKKIEIALHSFHFLLNEMKEENRDKVYLVIAGGYDPRVTENIEYFSELVDLVNQLKIENAVEFMKSPSDSIKQYLLRRATCLLYTPEKEHFGIVPIEAMCVGTPVIAVNSGGPTESIVDGTTGFLRDQTSESFADAMKYFTEGTVSKGNMSENCRNRVIDKFSSEEFANRLHNIVENLLNISKQE